MHIDALHDISKKKSYPSSGTIKDKLEPEVSILCETCTFPSLGRTEQKSEEKKSKIET